MKRFLIIGSAIVVVAVAVVVVWVFVFRGGGPAVAQDWNGADLKSAVAPHGDHIQVTGEPGLGTTEGEVSFSGTYDYRIETGSSGVTHVTGKFILEGADAGSSILVVAYSGSPGDPTLPSNLQQEFDMGRIFSGVTMRYIDYAQVSSGQVWLLQNDTGSSFGDVYVFAPGHVNVKFENPPSMSSGERLVLPDVTLPKESIEWNVSPPSSIDPWIEGALYPGSAY